MAAKSIKTLGTFVPPSFFDKGIGALLPQAYKKFYKEWKLTQPTAVHYVPEEGKWKRDDVTGEVSPVQNIPLPLIHPKEFEQHMLGGEAVIQGFVKKSKHNRRVPRFWFPVLKRSAVYSEILDKYISVVVTHRTINLIHSNYGFDHYLLKTPACDLKSLLPLSIKRKILQELENGCPTYSDRPEKQQEILKTYQGYLSAYTSEEIKWYGYSFTQACNILKQQLEEEEAAKVVPLKHVFRSQLVEKLRAAEIEEASATEVDLSAPESSTWLKKINPFGKKQET